MDSVCELFFMLAFMEQTTLRIGGAFCNRSLFLRRSLFP